MSISKHISERGYYKEYYKAAIGCWFTASGKTVPKMLKFEDNEGVVHTVNNIHLIRDLRETRSSGIAQCYECLAVINNRQCRFSLLFHPGENTWELIINK